MIRSYSAFTNSCQMYYGLSSSPRTRGSICRRLKPLDSRVRGNDGKNISIDIHFDKPWSNFQPFLTHRVIAAQVLRCALEHDMAVSHDIEAPRNVERDGQF